MGLSGASVTVGKVASCSDCSRAWIKSLAARAVGKNGRPSAGSGTPSAPPQEHAPPMRNPRLGGASEPDDGVYGHGAPSRQRYERVP